MQLASWLASLAWASLGPSCNCSGVCLRVYEFVGSAKLASKCRSRPNESSLLMLFALAVRRQLYRRLMLPEETELELGRGPSASDLSGAPNGRLASLKLASG